MTTTETGPTQRPAGSGLGGRERAVIIGTFLLVAALVGVDVVTDVLQGVSAWHVGLEVVAGSVAAGAALYLLRDSARMRGRLALQARDLSASRAQADAWQAQARKHVEGLSRSIDRQLDGWQLSAAEKEIAFLLLKGLSLKDIAQLRGTGEKTVRGQSAAIYAKSGLAGRSELSAFFLEDLLVPGEAAEPG